MKILAITLVCLTALAMEPASAQADGLFGLRNRSQRSTSSSWQSMRNRTPVRVDSTRGGFSSRRGLSARSSASTRNRSTLFASRNSSSRQEVRDQRRERARMNNQDLGFFSDYFYDSNFNGTIDTLEWNFGGMPGLWW
ncbi:MAG: hypothetical protein AAF802_29495 [Planctomycetota bacterium]